MEWMKKNKFWVIYAAVVLVFAMALTVGLAVLNSYLKAFEASQPIHVAEAVYARYFGKDSLEAALKMQVRSLQTERSLCQSEYQPHNDETARPSCPPRKK